MESQSPSASADPKSEPVEDSIVIETSAPTLTKETLDVMSSIVHRLTDYRDASGHDVSALFQRMINKRLLPDYFDVIKEPIAFSTIRGKILKKQYKSFKEFVRDMALISHNAQVYNRPSAPVYSDAIALREAFKAELKNLVDDGTITAEEAELPDFGEIPPVEDSPPPGPEDEEVEDDEDEDDEDEEDDDSDDDGARRRRRKGRRSSTLAAKRDGKVDDGNKDDPEAQKKRGRPPKVHTPMEARINALLKGLRKFKNPGGDLKIVHFEKMPDKSVMPEYYQEIKNPIAMDVIKRKAKRKKYHSVDQVLRDLELMFENAKEYNLEDSQVYKDAVDLQREARIIAEQEKKKPDSDFVDEEGKLPLPEILHNGEVWKVGDWIHLSNPNDVTKPIVAQIYRTWQDAEGQKWINACWYYRPEQTVHRFEKHFYENEVVKTGQYRDHKIEEVVDRCFVMFFTRFNKGRPRGFPPDKEVYVCEARYNEEKFKLNKIKTWASCVPDEVREKDYEMDLFDVPRKMKKVPSPIKHLLREDAKEDDPLPKPTWGAPNAPPIVGAVHRRPREPNESPPPEPTPSPPPPPPAEPARRSVTNERPYRDSQGDITMTGTQSNPAASPMVNPAPAQPSYTQQFTQPVPSATPSLHTTQQDSYSAHTPAPQTPTPQTPAYQNQHSYNHYAAPATVPVPQHTNPVPNYDHYRSNTVSRPSAPISTHSGHSNTNAYHPPRPIEVYHLGEAAVAIPADIRAQFHHDDNGRTIFFTTPPLDANPIPENLRNLGHSLRYLADKARRKEENDKKRKARELDQEPEADTKLKVSRVEMEKGKHHIVDQVAHAIGEWCRKMDDTTNSIYKDLYGDNWEEGKHFELLKLTRKQETASEEQLRLVEFQRHQEEKKKVSIIGFKWI
ncbi:hypothetical protein F5884DRAFT_658857 [Xylogone sp. PMI_703]|nr:hypothetical protein F5884DRAFT_658857 [Xylogone sp. PMI_703]